MSDDQKIQLAMLMFINDFLVQQVATQSFGNCRPESLYLTITKLLAKRCLDVKVKFDMAKLNKCAMPPKYHENHDHQDGLGQIVDGMSIKDIYTII
jgi:hypothetical protein